jgi:hypothetical protein
MTKKSKKRKTTKKKARYVCYDCGTEVIMDCCGVSFTRLICCGKTMKKTRKTK